MPHGKSVTIGNKTYELTDNPSMGVVKYTQQMQISMLRDYLDDEMVKEMDSLDEDAIIDSIMESGGFDALKNMMWERSLLEPVQTVCLATDTKFDSGVFEDMGAKDFKQIREDCEEALDGSAEDFFNELVIGISLNESEMERRLNQETSSTEAQKSE